VDFVNRHWREYTGLSTENTVGSGWQHAVHVQDLERYIEKWHASLATGSLFESEVRYRRAADAEYRWFLTRAVPLNGTVSRTTLKIASAQNKSTRNCVSSRPVWHTPTV
jgi:PAS domain-containing protein